MSLESRFECFKIKNSLDDSAMTELLALFNDSLLELAHKLLETTTPSATSTKAKKVSNKSGVKKWATKIAAEYAIENDVTLDNFDKEKITKKDIDEYMKSQNVVPKLKTEPVKKEVKKQPWYDSGEDSSKTCNGKCRGMNKSGDPCQKSGTTKPVDAKNHYCFKHAMDWKNYEVSSDSDLEEEETAQSANNEMCEIITNSE